MNWIKNIILLSLVLGICTGLLIIGDWFIAKKINTAIKNSNRQAKKIESERIRDEDIPQRKRLLSEGYLPLVYPALMDSLKINYPLIAGLPLTNTYYCNEGYGLISYRSDRFGFRNEDKIWDKNIKAIMIGDSFVQGACVFNEDTLPQKLSKKINSSVINLGMGSNNPSHYLTYSYLFIPKLKPQIVYLNFYANDNGLISKSNIEKKYVDQKIKIFSKNDLALFNLSLFLEEGNHAINSIRSNHLGTVKEKKIGFLQKAYRAIIRHSTLPTIRSILIKKVNFEQTERSITKTLELCNKFRCKVIVSFIPNSEYFRPDPRADNYADKISKLTSRLDINFVDGRKIINTRKNSQDFAIKGPHLSPEGYEKMAKAISEATK